LFVDDVPEGDFEVDFVLSLSPTGDWMPTDD
jgi:hypothetical protein